MQMYKESTRQLAQYTHQKRVNTEFIRETTDPIATAVGLNNIVYRKNDEGTTIEIDVLGTTINAQLDHDFALHFDSVGAPGIKMREWLEAEIYTNLLNDNALQPSHIVDGITEEEIAERTKKDTKILLQLIRQQPEAYSIEDEEFIALAINHDLPDLNFEETQSHIRTMREQAAAGLYTVSRRGYRVELNDPNSQTVELTAIEYKKTDQGIRVKLDFNGKMIERFIDSNMQIADFTDPKMNDWIQSQIFTYLARIRHSDIEIQDQVYETTQPGDEQLSADAESTPTEQTSKKPQHRAASLRVLPIGAQENRDRTIIIETPDGEIEETIDVDTLMIADFGISIHDLNALFRFRQIFDEPLPDEPQAIQDIIENLIQRIKSRDVQPEWVNEWTSKGETYNTSMMVLNNTPKEMRYDPLEHYYCVTYVMDTTLESEEPQEVRFSDVSFDHIYVQH